MLINSVPFVYFVYYFLSHENAVTDEMATNENSNFTDWDQDSDSLDSEKALNLALLEQDHIKNVANTKWNNSLAVQLYASSNLTPVSSPSSNNHSPPTLANQQQQQTITANPMAYAAALAAAGNQFLPLNQLAQLMAATSAAQQGQQQLLLQATLAQKLQQQQQQSTSNLPKVSSARLSNLGPFNHYQTV